VRVQRGDNNGMGVWRLARILRETLYRNDELSDALLQLIREGVAAPEQFGMIFGRSGGRRGPRMDWRYRWCSPEPTSAVVRGSESRYGHVSRRGRNCRLTDVSLATRFSRRAHHKEQFQCLVGAGGHSGEGQIGVAAVDPILRSGAMCSKPLRRPRSTSHGRRKRHAAYEEL